MAGCVVGIVSLTGQIGAGLLKIKAFADAIRDAPDEIRMMVNRMQYLNMVLLEVQAGLRSEVLNKVPSSSAQLCLNNCVESAKLLNRVVKDLEGEIAKRKLMGAFKWMMKQGYINRLQSGLDTASSMMILSQQTLMV